VCRLSTYIDASIQLGHTDECPSYGWVPHAMKVCRRHRHVTTTLYTQKCTHTYIRLLCLCVCVVYLFLNSFSFHQVIRLLNRKTVNKYLYLYRYINTVQIHRHEYVLVAAIVTATAMHSLTLGRKHYTRTPKTHTYQD